MCPDFFYGNALIVMTLEMFEKTVTAPKTKRPQLNSAYPRPLYVIKPLLLAKEMFCKATAPQAGLLGEPFLQNDGIICVGIDVDLTKP
mgnify:CR=1 FL=1